MVILVARIGRLARPSGARRVETTVRASARQITEIPWRDSPENGLESSV
jgi:hypothetical protein